ncbi:transglutaminase-like cysteine peptidase [Rhizobium sp. AQ_MP]|uniref:transglutaminase-like cysteine peptidase n=1 Tax=Rhizobium sp. AQ_MP TaxID=2761536 RepID=UPI00163AFC57|nr:transglutaminase-like cysteine peptidase [Rhizobium sp. AQ_MP]MBC2771380.1 transglutaminase-like cysteine peptidase [Rhizobium sp. AQ_MP]
MKNGSRAIKALIIAVAVLAPAHAGLSAPQSLRSMITGAVTSQPIGHYEFCKALPDECNVRTRPTLPPKVTDHGWTVIRDINASVNHAIVPMTDMEIYGREEVWAYPVDVGDCEDFVLLKRKKLMAAGFKAADLLITVVRKPDGEGHAVLTVRTQSGDFVLDNLNDDVKLWSETRYAFLKRQSSTDSGRWVTIENGTSDVLVGALQ